MFCEFGELSFQLIYLLLCPLGSAIRTLSFQNFDGYYHEFLCSCFVMFLSEIASGTIPFFFKCCGKGSNEPSKKEVSNQKNEANPNTKEKSEVNVFFSIIPDTDNSVNKRKQLIKKQLLLAICGLLDFLSFNLLSLGCGGVDTMTGNALNQELRNSKIISLCLFCKFILRSSFYKHHIFSICMILCGVFLNIIIYFSFLFEGITDSKGTYIVLLLLPISYVFASLQMVLEKYFLNTYKESPYYLMFYEGIYGSIFTGLSASPLAYTTCKWSESICNDKDSYFSLRFLREDLRKISFWGFILSLFLGGIICNVFTRLAIEAFSPTHQNVSDCLSSLLLLPFEYGILDALKLVPGTIFVTLGSFIYSEIIILHAFGLSEYTKKQIYIRSESELALSLKLMDSESIASQKKLQEVTW